MKKQLLILTAILCATPTLAKVTYEDAVASSAAFHERNNSVSKKPRDRGLTEIELQDNAANQMGKWVKESSTPLNWATSGEYAMLLSPGAIGKSCVKGSKGLIATQSTIEGEKECASGHYDASGQYHCHYYHESEESNTTDLSQGYPAECK